VHAAPEVLAGGAPTPASDVWSLASTAHHLLSGSAPFRKVTDESSATLLARIQRDPTPNLHDHGVPTWLCRVLDAAMAKDPADRPSVRRFLLSLDTHGAALDDPDADSLAFDDEGPVPEVAAPPGFKDPFANLPKKYRRHRRLRRVLLGLAVVAVIGGAAALALLL
jgi:serine/threonine protein kinase